MFNFLGMLQGAQGAMGAAGGASQGGGLMGRFGQALGKENMGKGSEKIGMQYANAAINDPGTPNMANAVRGMGVPMGQQGQRQQLPMHPFLQALLSGGR